MGDRGALLPILLLAGGGVAAFFLLKDRSGAPAGSGGLDPAATTTSPSTEASEPSKGVKRAAMAAGIIGAVGTGVASFLGTQN